MFEHARLNVIMLNLLQNILIFTASYNAHPSYPQHQQGWGVQPGASYFGQQQQQQPYPPPPVCQPMPPPTYAENVIAGPPPQHTN